MVKGKGKGGAPKARAGPRGGLAAQAKAAPKKPNPFERNVNASKTKFQVLGRKLQKGPAKSVIDARQEAVAKVRGE
jgi:hypothetical protein